MLKIREPVFGGQILPRLKCHQSFCWWQPWYHKLSSIFPTLYLVSCLVVSAVAPFTACTLIPCYPHFLSPSYVGYSFLIPFLLCSNIPSVRNWSNALISSLLGNNNTFKTAGSVLWTVFICLVKALRSLPSKGQGRCGLLLYFCVFMTSTSTFTSQVG